MGAPVPHPGSGAEGKSWRTEFKEFLTKQRGFVARNELLIGTHNAVAAGTFLSPPGCYFWLKPARWGQTPPPPATGSLQASGVRGLGPRKGNRHLPALHSQRWEQLRSGAGRDQLPLAALTGHRGTRGGKDTTGLLPAASPALSWASRPCPRWERIREKRQGPLLLLLTT